MTDTCPVCGTEREQETVELISLCSADPEVVPGPMTCPNDGDQAHWEYRVEHRCG